MEVYKIACLENFFFFCYICVIKPGESLWSLAVPAGVNSHLSCFLCVNGNKSWLARGIWVLIPLCPHWEQHWCQYLCNNDTQIPEKTEWHRICMQRQSLNKCSLYYLGTVNLSSPPSVSCFLSDLCAFQYLCKNFSSAACHIALSQNHRISLRSLSPPYEWPPPCARPWLWVPHPVFS